MKKGSKHSPETMAKMSASAKIRVSPPFSKEHRKKIGDALRGRKKPESVVKSIIESNKRRSGEKCALWKGGKLISKYGYVLVYAHNHPKRIMNNYVFEHRLVVEKMIGRYLETHEKIHHINGDKTDNRPENLMCFTSQSVHKKFESDASSVKKSEIVFDGRHAVSS